MITKKLLNEAELERAQTFYILKLTTVIIINKNKNIIFTIC